MMYTLFIRIFAQKYMRLFQQNAAPYQCYPLSRKSSKFGKQTQTRNRLLAESKNYRNFVFRADNAHTKTASGFKRA